MQEWLIEFQDKRRVNRCMMAETEKEVIAYIENKYGCFRNGSGFKVKEMKRCIKCKNPIDGNGKNDSDLCIECYDRGNDEI